MKNQSYATGKNKITTVCKSKAVELNLANGWQKEKKKNQSNNKKLFQ
jgi:hypothetical protein